MDRHPEQENICALSVVIGMMSNLEDGTIDEKTFRGRLPEFIDLISEVVESLRSRVSYTSENGEGGSREDASATEANASLIEAAPDLLIAGKNALSYMRLHKYADQAWADDLEKAINKASGITS